MALIVLAVITFFLMIFKISSNSTPVLLETPVDNHKKHDDIGLTRWKEEIFNKLEDKLREDSDITKHSESELANWKKSINEELENKLKEDFEGIPDLSVQSITETLIQSSSIKDTKDVDIQNNNDFNDEVSVQKDVEDTITLEHVHPLPETSSTAVIKDDAYIVDPEVEKEIEDEILYAREHYSLGEPDKETV
eukprot:UN31609